MDSYRAARSRQPRAFRLLSDAAARGRLPAALLVTCAASGEAARLCEAWAHLAVCEQPAAEPCGSCPGCRKIAAHSHPDVHVLRPNDKGIISIDAVRQLIMRLALTSHGGGSKLVLGLPIDAMNQAAQNAFLKVLEEPPGQTQFVLASVNAARLLPTLVSRCQKLALQMPQPQAIEAALQQAEVPAHLWPWMAPLSGDDAAGALRLVDQGIEATLHSLQRAAEPGCGPQVCVEVAQELGRDRPSFELALSLCELGLCAALAQRLGAKAAPLALFPTSLPMAALWRLRSQLLGLRRDKAINLNRTMALETLLLPVATLEVETAGSAAPSPGPR